MANKYFEQEIEKIITDTKYEFPLNNAMAGAWIMGNFKAENLKIIDVRGRSSLTDYFVLASAQNQTQARAIADEISRTLKSHGSQIFSKEGFEQGEWILIDSGDVIFHIFQDNVREIYDFDNVWRGAEIITIPNEFYHQDPVNNNQSEESDERDYF
ncbi:MAG: ribosome silencing factor [Halobacteriovoraceae bacterium]|nr:ribosome silencing factor [Halobacteriovoraceae bacterium]